MSKRASSSMKCGSFAYGSVRLRSQHRTSPRRVRRSEMRPKTDIALPGCRGGQSGQWAMSDDRVCRRSNGAIGFRSPGCRWPKPKIGLRTHDARAGRGFLGLANRFPALSPCTDYLAKASQSRLSCQRAILQKKWAPYGAHQAEHCAVSVLRDCRRARQLGRE